MKILWGVIGALILIALVAVYLNHYYRDPRIPSFTPASRRKPAAKVPAPPYPFLIEGDLRKRKLIHFVLPTYPAWAEEQGVSGIYKVRVTVSPAGEVKSFIQPLHTTGHQDLDEAALAALKTWRFNPVSQVIGDQEGTIAFQFRLVDRPAAPTSPPALRTRPAPDLGAGENSRAVQRYEDLGPDSLDVSSYPEPYRTSYQVFRLRCNRCHSSARAINSPIASRKEWEYFVGLMHTRSMSLWAKPEEKQWIVDFLTYDSQVRKIDRRELFLKDQQTLQKQFDQQK